LRFPCLLLPQSSLNSDARQARMQLCRWTWNASNLMRIPTQRIHNVEGTRFQALGLLHPSHPAVDRRRRSAPVARLGQR
jgi:hypothetical protein